VKARAARSITRSAVLQRALIVLLAIDCAVYVVEGGAREAADSLAWFTLLVLFYIETSARPRARPVLIVAGIRCLRIAAAAVVAASAYAYVLAGAWLDAANSALWIAVVVLLEVQVRYPACAQRRRSAFTATAVLLYGALSVLPAVWLVQREWLAAYDAVLWLAAFAIIEMSVWNGGEMETAGVTHTRRERPR
jgi:hypothetical protein